MKAVENNYTHPPHQGMGTETQNRTEGLKIRKMAQIPRKFILCEDALFHVTWQCHNRNFLLKPRWAKEFS